MPVQPPSSLPKSLFHRAIVWWPCLGWVIMAVGVTGCQSVDARIKQQPEVFHQLSTEDQQRLRDRIAKLGDTPEMVRIAYGNPDKEETIITSSGRERTVWTYHGQHHMKTGSRTQPPVYGTVPVVHDYKVVDFVLAEVTFLDGKVVNLRNPANESGTTRASIHSVPSTTVEAPEQGTSIYSR